MEDAIARGAPPPTAEGDPYAFTLLSDPKSLSSDEARRLGEAFAALSWRATGGADWHTYEAGRVGWVQYYQGPGGRPTDFERLVLVHHGDDLAHFAGCQLLEIDGRTVVWVHIAVTDPAHQGRGLLLRASRLLLDPQWIASLPRRVVVFRTPNPIVYEAARAEGERFASQFPGRFSVRCYPEIDPAGGRLPAPPEIERLAERIAQTLSPECEFVPASFVIRGYFRAYGQLYKEFDFPCRNPAVRGYFARHADERNCDGVLVLLDVAERR